MTQRNEIYYNTKGEVGVKKHKAIPQGYMTVGELAKKMGVTVRTLQHYDKEGLLSPSAVSEGGRRLYTDKDIIQLHQIMSLKHLGFSLSDIKNRLIPLESPAEIAAVLAEQAGALRQKIESLSQSLKELQMLQDEVLQMQAVNFGKYADIIVNLQMKNDYYCLIKYMDDRTLDHARRRFDKDGAAAFMHTFLQLQQQAAELHAAGVSPAGDRGQAFAKAYWDMITEFTGGDSSILNGLMQLEQAEGMGAEWKETQGLAQAFVEQALDAYFTNLGLDPFQEETE